MKRFAPPFLATAALVGAIAAAAAFGRAAAETKTADGVILYDAREVAEAFAKGRPIHTAPDLKINAGHRDSVGTAEIHEADTDVFYVVAGEGTFVTGGKVIDPRIDSPGETRGSRIEGGRPLALKKGDVIVIPRGVPHWFSEVPRSIDYFVVKVPPPAVKGAKTAK